MSHEMSHMGPRGKAASTALRTTAIDMANNNTQPQPSTTTKAPTQKPNTTVCATSPGKKPQSATRVSNGCASLTFPSPQPPLDHNHNGGN